MNSEFLAEKAKEIMAAPSCCAELKAACESYLSAVGTSDEAAAQSALIAEIKEDITTVDDLIALAESEMGAKIFGEEAAKGVAAHAKQIKEQGAKYCDCPACKACEEVLANI